ncbi:tripartite motif-containing protein 16-like [Synchiropus picturatus]
MEAKVDLQRESFSCSICLHLLKDPVTLPCGHSFCQVCVERYWDSEGERNICQCPQCRRTFTPRPLLQKNVMLAELVEELKKTGLQAADLCYAGPEDVACDSCTGRKLKALKSCLLCLTSYCEQHLQPHLEAPAFRRHKLVQPSKQLQEIICPQHDKVKEIFCRTDQQVICHLCAVDQHKDHHIVSAAAERREREKEVDQSRGRIQQSIQEREEELKLLQQQQKTIKDSADKAVKDSQESLQQMIQNLQIRMADVEQQIRSRQETEAAGVGELQEQLEQEIAELKKKDAELQQLSLTDSHLVFLQNWSSPSEVSEDTLSCRTHVRPHCCFEEVAAAVSASRERLQDLLRDTCTNISLMLGAEPKTRAEFLRFSRDITLDPNTAHSKLLLSEGNRKVRNMGEDQSPPHHPDRFTHYPQVLSKEPLTGRCYWEVEWREEVDVAVSYKNISRSGDKSEFGCNDKSWSLYCHDSGCSFTHNSITPTVSSVRPSRVGVYLDHSAGLLSFYSVSGTMTLLHRVHTTFTQPLHAGVWVCGTCEFLKLNETTMTMTVSHKLYKDKEILN